MTSEPLYHDRSYFVDQYRSNPDPWGFDDRWYEQRKYAITLAALPDRRYRNAQEPGCANGTLTRLLAERCDKLVGYELIESVAATARERLSELSHVTIENQAFPEWQPTGTGDLVVWSEVAYYLTPTGFDTATKGVEQWLEPGGVLLAVHYTGDTNYPRSGDDTHDAIDELSYLNRIAHLVDHSFRLDVWRRTPTGADPSRSPEE